MAIWSLHLTKPQTGAQLGSMKEMDILPSGDVTGPVEEIPKEQVAEDGKEAQDQNGHVTGPGEGIPKEQVAEDGKEAQDQNGLEDEEETNILTSINCLPEPPLNERMGAIAFSSKDEEKDQWSKNQQNKNQQSENQQNQVLQKNQRSKEERHQVQQNQDQQNQNQQNKNQRSKEELNPVQQNQDPQSNNQQNQVQEDKNQRGKDQQNQAQQNQAQQNQVQQNKNKQSKYQENQVQQNKNQWSKNRQNMNQCSKDQQNSDQQNKNQQSKVQQNQVQLNKNQQSKDKESQVQQNKNQQSKNRQNMNQQSKDQQNSDQQNKNQQSKVQQNKNQRSKDKKNMNQRSKDQQNSDQQNNNQRSKDKGNQVQQNKNQQSKDKKNMNQRSKDQQNSDQQNKNQQSRDQENQVQQNQAQQNQAQQNQAQQNKNQWSKDLQSKVLQWHAPVTLRCSFSLAKMLVIALAIYLPPLAAGADLEVREKDLGHKGLSANESLQVTDNITRSDLLDGPYFGVFTSRGYEEFICTWEFVEKNQECRLELGINEQCHGLSIVKDALQEHVHIALDGASVEDQKSICIAQHVPNQFVVYQVETFRKPAPTCRALTTSTWVKQSGCEQDPPGYVKLGSVCKFSCPNGYIGHGDVNKTCQSMGTWSSTNFTCEVVTCPVTGPLQTGCIPDSSGQTTVGSICTFPCPSGNQEGAVHKVCQPNGTWTTISSTCQGPQSSAWKYRFGVMLAIFIVLCVLMCLYTPVLVMKGFYPDQYKRYFCRGDNSGEDAAERHSATDLEAAVPESVSLTDSGAGPSTRGGSFDNGTPDANTTGTTEIEGP